MKKKLRRITVDGRDFLWRTGKGDPFSYGQERWKEEFVAYLEGNKKSPLRISFEMGLCDENGDLTFGEDGLLESDMNVRAYWPKGAEHFIRHGIRLGWCPEESATPFLIEDGSEIFQSLERP